jgi:hypothetical protein
MEITLSREIDQPAPGIVTFRRMRSPNRFGAWWPLLCGAVCGCSPSTGQEPHVGGGGSAAAGAQAGSAAQTTGGVPSGAGTGVAGGNVFPVSGGAAGAAGASGGLAAQAGASGAPTGGTMSASGSAGSSAGQSGAGTSAACAGVASEYRTELERQLSCNPNASQQCTDRAAAAPGCECRVFIEPTDPFAIEHLSNVANGWFDADCSLPSCPAKCSTASAGTCQPNASSPLGGRCVSP